MGNIRKGAPRVDTGGVKKTSPMKGKVFFTGDTHTDRRTSRLYDQIGPVGRFSEKPWATKYITNKINWTKLNLRQQRPLLLLYAP